jgi:uracil-DNA glycosylase family 4
MDSQTRQAEQQKTRWQLHAEKWKSCQLCELCNQRTQVVLARGELPAAVMFVAEAPGTSEDAIGEPLVGPAGQLLDRMIKAALNGRQPPTMGFTNIVACFPRDAKQTENHAPPLAAIKACSARLKEFVAICDPRLVVCVGALASKHIGLSVDAASEKIDIIHIDHPAAIGRMDRSQQGLAFKRAVLRLAKALEVLR